MDKLVVTVLPSNRDDVLRHRNWVCADWVKLERKGRYAGEVYLELTWYSNVRTSLSLIDSSRLDSAVCVLTLAFSQEPRPIRTSRKASVAKSPTRGVGGYGGAGSRVEDHLGSEAETEEWDGGSQVGLSSNLHKGSQASLSSVRTVLIKLAGRY